MEKEFNESQETQCNESAMVKSVNKANCPCATKIKRIGQGFCILSILIAAMLTFYFILNPIQSPIAFFPMIIAALNCTLYPFIKGFAYIVANNEIKFQEKHKSEL